MTTTVPLGSPGLQEMDGASNYFTNREVNGSVTSLTSSPAQSALEALKRSRSSTVGGHTPAISRQTSIRTQTRGNTMRHSTRDASTSFDAQPPYIPELSASQRIPASSSLEGMPRSAGLESEQQWPGQLEAKVVILGSQGVGKTSLVTRYTTGQFSTTLSSTIGASFMTKRIVVPGCRVR